MDRRIVLGVELLIFAAALACLLLTPLPRHRPGVTQENFRRLHQGMTEAQVEAIFGAQARFRLRYTGNHVSYWDKDGLGVVIRFNDISINGYEYGAFEGQLSRNGEQVLELRPEPNVSSMKRQFMAALKGGIPSF